MQKGEANFDKLYKVRPMLWDLCENRNLCYFVRDKNPRYLKLQILVNLQILTTVVACMGNCLALLVKCVPVVQKQHNHALNIVTRYKYTTFYKIL
jgi:hypothetical protein